MQNFMQFKHLVHYGKIMYVRLRNICGSVNEMSQLEQVKMLLDYLINYRF